MYKSPQIKNHNWLRWKFGTVFTWPITVLLTHDGWGVTR